ncbi:MAG: TonB-dependent receptor [Rariglobus sp.]
MRRFRIPFVLLLIVPVLRAENPAPAGSDTPVELEPVEVYSPRVANQGPVASFAAPVTALRFEPLVDVQARNFAEGQADIIIRGGTFESSGFSIGAVPIFDPQTGHYLAELPVAPAMLGAPGVRTGADNAMAGWNATAGSVAYGWQPIRTGGYIATGAGDNDLFRSELYSGYKSDKTIAGRTLAADASVAYSESDGTRTFGGHEFSRFNVRLQMANDVSQTDLFAGRQDKEFGWPNMYAARNFTTPIRDEREDLETELLVLNHKVQFGADGDYFQIGSYLRRNKDHYQIPVLLANSRHVSDVSGIALDGRVSVAEHTALLYRGGVIADELGSTSLVVGPNNGRYNDRTQYYTGLFAEHTIPTGGNREWVFTGGANYDGSNREEEELSPTAKIETRSKQSAVKSLYVSYAESSQLPSYTTLNNNNTAGLFIGDRDLGRSTSSNIEIGAATVVGGWDVKTAVFYRIDNDLVDWTFDATTLNTPGLTSRTAVAVDVETLGAEIVAQRDYGFIGVVLGYSFLDKIDDLPATRGSFYALDYAEHRLTAAFIGRLGGGFELRMDNEARIQADNALRRSDKQVVLSSLGLYYTVPYLKNLTLSAQADNLWNTYYEEVPLVPGARREWSVGARYAW